MRKFNVKDFKISFDSERTRVYYNGQYVVAELFGRVHTPKFSYGFWDENVALGDFTVCARGIARPMLGDVYDPEVGKKIALAKAENKAYDMACKTIMRRVTELLEFNSAAFRFQDKVESVKKHNAEYIERIGASTEKTTEESSEL